MDQNLFFERKGPFLIKDLFKDVNSKNISILDVKTLEKSSNQDLTFFDTIKYKDYANLTKAGCCITTSKLQKYLPKNCIKILVNNVLYELAKITKKFYPSADVDFPDLTLKIPNTTLYKGVKFGNNVLIGKNVKIGDGSIVGSNTIIESNVSINKNCIIGSQIVIKNSIIGENVIIQDGCKIGLKGFGFIPLKEKNIKFPHIGKVVLHKNIEIGSSCTIDRGSIDDTVIGENTYLDNQVHIAHNVKIGKNCMIAGQVGFAGSSVIGNNVSIGGQAGISGHLKIGDNVKIGGGSGVIKDIENNSIVMGYPAIKLKNFLKNSKIK